MKINTVREFVISESEARALHDLIAELSLAEHLKMLANPTSNRVLYNGSVEDAHTLLSDMYYTLHNAIVE